MVAHFTMCTNWVNQTFRFVEGIGNTKRVFKYDVLSRKKDLVYIIRAQRGMSNLLIYKPWIKRFFMILSQNFSIFVKGIQVLISITIRFGSIFFVQKWLILILLVVNTESSLLTPLEHRNWTQHDRHPVCPISCQQFVLVHIRLEDSFFWTIMP